jgi:hypothetical protein
MCLVIKFILIYNQPKEHGGMDFCTENVICYRPSRFTLGMSCSIFLENSPCYSPGQNWTYKGHGAKPLELVKFNPKEYIGKKCFTYLTAGSFL